MNVSSVVSRSIKHSLMLLAQCLHTFQPLSLSNNLRRGSRLGLKECRDLKQDKTTGDKG